MARKNRRKVSSLGIAALSRVLNGRAALSPEMALRLADALGGSVESWLHLQANYNLWQARQKPRKPIARLETHAG
ncbi:MAG: HigA family addiction module antitoxin [Methylovulum sp.]|nr:HigA family addiction module antitoxin [Methylovulum sp.]